MIREVGKKVGRTVLDGIGRAASRLQENRSLSVDLLESDDAFLAIFDAPGATADDIAVRFEKNAISARIDRFREFHDDHEMIFPGRGLGLSGSVDLPEGAVVDADRAEATLTESGTLEVLVPKAETDGIETDESTADADVEADESAETPDDVPDAQ